MPHTCSLPHFRKFAAKNWDEINTLVSMHQFRDKQIHSIRKKLKDLFYNLNHFKGAEACILSRGNWNDRALEYLESMMAEMGNFQDNQKAVELLITRIIDADCNAECQQVWRKLVTTWQQEKQQRKLILVHQLKLAVSV